IDPQLLQAADDLGGKPWTIFRTITFPISMSGVVAGTILVFVPMLGDYVTPTIMGGARGLMVGSLVASEFNEGQNWSLGAAMAILLVLLLVGVVAAVWLLTTGVQFARSRIRQRTLNREWVK
ncbi:MAG TPA: ABC transporter permease subunit, partial [Acidimicrobiales bacterium]